MNYNNDKVMTQQANDNACVQMYVVGDVYLPAIY